MELNISEKEFILPSALVGVKETLQIADNGTGDCVKETKRKTKDDKSFSQYEICFKDQYGNEKIAQFLLSQHLKPLVKELGQQTSAWIGQFVEITGVPEEKGDKTYYSLNFKSVGVPNWAVEKVE